VNIAGVAVGYDQPCRFVAELSNNHNGDRDRLGRLIDAAQGAGADIVKVQCYTPEELVALRGDGPAPEPWGAQGWTMRTLYEKAQTPLDWFPKIAAHCERIGMPWFSSVFGLKSLECLEAVGCPAYKIAALDNHVLWLRNAVARTGKPWLVSVRGDEPMPGADGLLHCPPGYPAQAETVALPYFARNSILGLSSHCLAPELPVAAVARGCRLIEMHLMLSDEPSELEAPVSLTEWQFRMMVRSVRTTEEMLG
jgi:pseudaminic acid synthase